MADRARRCSPRRFCSLSPSLVPGLRPLLRFSMETASTYSRLRLCDVAPPPAPALPPRRRAPPSASDSARSTPDTTTMSPGAKTPTRSARASTSMERGTPPATSARSSVNSCTLIRCQSAASVMGDESCGSNALVLRHSGVGQAAGGVYAPSGNSAMHSISHAGQRNNMRAHSGLGLPARTIVPRMDTKVPTRLARSSRMSANSRWPTRRSVTRPPARRDSEEMAETAAETAADSSASSSPDACSKMTFRACFSSTACSASSTEAMASLAMDPCS
mmetsp:Transcript_874/g.2650  ORF Transcript_874/g.2650 Transcript_874/m.2650 type:complete len:275 (-) Transcript_874:292-1116(-)